MAEDVYINERGKGGDAMRVKTNVKAGDDKGMGLDPNGGGPRP
jgi:ribosomal protein S28E/S33